MCRTYRMDQDEIVDGIINDNDQRVALDAEDKLLCAVAKEKLYRAQHDWTFSWLWKVCIPVATCSSVARCAAARKQLQAELRDVFPAVRGLQSWAVKWDGKLCERCATVARRKHERGRARVWRELPRIFDFTTWGDLLLVEEDKVREPIGKSLLLRLIVIIRRRKSRTGLTRSLVLW